MGMLQRFGLHVHRLGFELQFYNHYGDNGIQTACGCCAGVATEWPQWLVGQMTKATAI